MQKILKTDERSLRYLKTDHGTLTDGQMDHAQGRLLRSPLGKPGVQKLKQKNRQKGL